MKPLLHYVRRGGAVLLVSLLIAACGGGGDGGSFPGNPPVSGGPGGGQDGGNSGGSDYAVLSWIAPTSRDDGSCLQDLKEYRINYGNSPGVYEEVKSVAAEDLSCAANGQTDACGAVTSCTYVLSGLAEASWYFSVQAVDSAGNASDYSNEAIKTISR